MLELLEHSYETEILLTYETMLSRRITSLKYLEKPFQVDLLVATAGRLVVFALETCAAIITNIEVRAHFAKLFQFAVHYCFR